MPQDLWVGSAAGLRGNAEAVKDTYCVPACECEVPPTVKGVHRPPSHDDVHDDDVHDDDGNVAGAECLHPEAISNTTSSGPLSFHQLRDSTVRHNQ